MTMSVPVRNCHVLISVEADTVLEWLADEDNGPPFEFDLDSEEVRSLIESEAPGTDDLLEAIEDRHRDEHQGALQWCTDPVCMALEDSRAWWKERLA